MNEMSKQYGLVTDEQIAFLGNDPIPTKPYFDPHYFELERKAVFMKVWNHIGHVCEVPESGSFIRRELEFAKASLLIIRGRDGNIRAFHNICTHRGTQLVAEAQGKQSKFSCPYHMWTFGTDGALLSAPDFEAFNLDKKDCSLPQVRLEVCGGMIFVNFDAEAPSLKEWLGDYYDRLEQMPVAHATTFAEYTYEMDANWKLTYDNFQENYHLRFVHPRSGGAGVAEPNPFGYPELIGFNGPHRTQRIWQNPTPDVKPYQAKSFGRIMKPTIEKGIMDLPYGRDYLALFPNVFVIGTPTQPFSHTVYPIAANKSRGVIRIYWKGEDGTASEKYGREYGLATLRDIHSEDIMMIEAGQRGLESGAIQHIHFQRMEVLCRHLITQIDERVQAYACEQGEVV